MSATEEETREALENLVGEQNAVHLAAALRANGARFSEPPELLVEARILPYRRVGETNRVLVVLEPTFIAYNSPSFQQRLRFWDHDERHFAMQLQLAAAPQAPTANAMGANVLLGSYRPGARVLLANRQSLEFGPRASHVFELDITTLYNGRVSITESSSSSEFARFWATVVNAPAVQQAAINEINQAVAP